MSKQRNPNKPIDDTSYDIYALVDPRDNIIRYVGMSKNAKKRFLQHITCSGNNLSKNAWILDLHKLGLLPSLQIIETIEGKARALTHEEYWICFYAEKQSLTNFNHNLEQIDGGTRIDRFILNELRQVEEVRNEF